MREYIGEILIDGDVKVIFPIKAESKTKARKRIKLNLRELRARRNK